MVVPCACCKAAAEEMNRIAVGSLNESNQTADVVLAPSNKAASRGAQCATRLKLGKVALRVQCDERET